MGSFFWGFYFGQASNGNSGSGGGSGEGGSGSVALAFIGLAVVSYVGWYAYKFLSWINTAFTELVARNDVTVYLLFPFLAHIYLGKTGTDITKLSFVIWICCTVALIIIYRLQVKVLYKNLGAILCTKALSIYIYVAMFYQGLVAIYYYGWGRALILIILGMFLWLAIIRFYRSINAENVQDARREYLNRQTISGGETVT